MIFNNNAHIALSTEIIDITLEDQTELKNMKILDSNNKNFDNELNKILDKKEKLLIDLL